MPNRSQWPNDNTFKDNWGFKYLVYLIIDQQNVFLTDDCHGSKYLRSIPDSESGIFCWTYILSKCNRSFEQELGANKIHGLVSIFHSYIKTYDMSCYLYFDVMIIKRTFSKHLLMWSLWAWAYLITKNKW
jgi:hypothetical protein